MLIVLEGVDGSGKTTLANAIRDRFDGRVLHRSAPIVHPLVEYTADLAEYQPGSGEVLILDRWHLSEWVYGPQYRGQTPLTWVQFQAIDEFLVSKGAILVYCSGSVSNVVTRLLDRGDPLGDDPASLGRDQRRYEQVLAFSTLRPRLEHRSNFPLTIDEIVGTAIQREDEVCLTSS
jgi:thymidylate kinase